MNGPWAALREETEALAPARWAAAIDAVFQPWRVAVVGRVGAGKTSLIRAATGTPFGEVGLGGVTRASAEITDGGRVWIDTPGLDDDPLDSVACDGVVWVVDGLMPAGCAERSAVAQAVAGRPLDVVVSRLDLVDDDEVPGVLDRVARLAAPLGARSVVRVDLRRPSALGDVGAPDEAVLRGRREAVLDTIAAWMEGLPPLVDPPTEVLLDAEWRRLVRGVIEHPDPRGFFAGAWPAWRAWTAWVASVPQVAAAGPPRVASPPAGRRDAAAARWVLEGSLTLRTWADAVRQPAAWEARRRVWRAIAAARTSPMESR